MLQNLIPGIYSLVLLKGSRKLCGKKVVCVFYVWEENVCKWGENSKAFLESVTASCGSHWWAQLGWEVCADVSSDCIAASIPAKGSFGSQSQSEDPRLWSWLNHTCRHLLMIAPGYQERKQAWKSQGDDALRRGGCPAVNCWACLPSWDTDKASHDSDFQEADGTWQSFVARCRYLIAITSDSEVSLGSGRNATWKLDWDEDFGFWISLLGQCFEQTS